MSSLPPPAPAPAHPPVQQMQPLFISNISSLACTTRPSSTPTCKGATRWVAGGGVFLKHGAHRDACHLAHTLPRAPPHLPKLVLDDGNAHAVLLLQDPVDQRRLARADWNGEAGQQGRVGWEKASVWRRRQGRQCMTRAARSQPLHASPTSSRKPVMTVTGTTILVSVRAAEWMGDGQLGIGPQGNFLDKTGRGRLPAPASLREYHHRAAWLMCQRQGRAAQQAGAPCKLSPEASPPKLIYLLRAFPSPVTPTVVS